MPETEVSIKIPKPKRESLTDDWNGEKPYRPSKRKIMGGMSSPRPPLIPPSHPLFPMVPFYFRGEMLLDVNITETHGDRSTIYFRTEHFECWTRIDIGVNGPELVMTRMNVHHSVEERWKPTDLGEFWRTDRPKFR